MTGWGSEKGTKRIFTDCSKSQKGFLSLGSSDCPWGEARGGRSLGSQKLLGIPGVRREALRVGLENLQAPVQGKSECQEKDLKAGESLPHLKLFFCTP